MRGSYIIHLDASAPKEMHAALPSLAGVMSDPEAVAILPAVEVSWGGPSMLQVPRPTSLQHASSTHTPGAPRTPQVSALAYV